MLNPSQSRRSRANSMKNKCKKQLMVFSLIGLLLVLGGLIDDILIKCRVITKYIIVSENYILYVFSLVFTVATLGCTLLSIIVSASNNKVLGLQLREVVSLENSPLKLKTVIIITLSMVAVSIPLLAFELHTSITMLALCLISYIVYNTTILCEVVFNSETSKEIILSNLRTGKNIKPDYIQYWITALFSTITENDIAAEEEYISLLMSAANENEQNREQIGNQISQLFDLSCENQSFIDSYKRIIRLNNTSKVFFDERTIIFNHLKNYKYADPKSVDIINLSGTIDNVVLCDFLSDNEKVNICYWLFNAVLSNTSVDETDKLTSIYDGLCSLLWLDDHYGFGDVRVNTAVLFFKKAVLLAKDFEFGKEIFKQIIKAVYNRNQYRHSKPLFSFLAQLVRMIYFWSYLEVETLSEKRRQLIATLPNCVVDTIDNALLTIDFLIEKHHNGIVEFLISDSFNSNMVDPLDYWPDVLNGKAVVCTPESKIKFALWFYSIWGYGFYLFPIEKYVLTDTKEHTLLSKTVCTAALEEFDTTNYTLNTHRRECVAKLQQLFNKRSLLPAKYLEASFNTINSIIIDIIKKQTAEPLDSSLVTINDLLLKSIIDNPEILYDHTISLDSSVSVQLPQILCSNNSDYISAIVYHIKYELTNIVNLIVEKRLPKITLDFDLTGIIKLKEALEKDKFISRNYTYYDDWGIKGDIRGTQDYLELKSLVDGITPLTNYHLRPHVFLKVEDVRFNYSIVEIARETPAGEVLEKFLSQYRVANDQYNIDGAVFNKTAAVEHFKTTKLLISAKIKVETNVQTTSGFQIVFRENEDTSETNDN